jgi:hypothetical protein
MSDDKSSIDDLAAENYPSKLSAYAKLAKGAKKALVFAMQKLMPYYSTLREPECMAYAIGDMVKNLRHMPRDISHYLCGHPDKLGNIENLVNDYKIPDNIVGDALLLSEGAAWAGSYVGACLSGNVICHNYAQAIGGGLIGSEVTTAATFFLALSAVNSIFYLKNRRKAANPGYLRNKIAKATFRTTAYALPLGLLSFTIVDVGISSLSVYLGTQPEVAATIGAVCGTVFYLGSAKASIAHINQSKS